MTKRACPVCKTPDQLVQDIKHDVRKYTCIRCGVFSLTEDAWTIISSNKDYRVRLSGRIRRATDAQGEFYTLIHTKNLEEVANDPGAPRNGLDRAHMLIRHIGTVTKFPGDFTPNEHFLPWLGRLNLEEAPDLQMLASSLREAGLVEYIVDQDDENQFRFGLPVEGWRYFEELSRVGGSGDQAFVAMWFHPDMDEVYDKGIYPVLDACGYKPYRVDRAANLDRVDSKVVAEIRRSRLMICDVTGERPSVHYEAGFAQGLGIPVIWCCDGTRTAYFPPDGTMAPHMTEAYEPVEKFWKDRRHFDTQQFPHIFWENAEHLRIRLTEMIVMQGLNLKPAKDVLLG